MFLRASNAMISKSFTSEQFSADYICTNDTLFCVGCKLIARSIALSPERYVASLVCGIQQNGAEGIHTIPSAPISSTIVSRILNAYSDNCSTIISITISRTFPSAASDHTSKTKQTACSSTPLSHLLHQTLC